MGGSLAGKILGAAAKLIPALDKRLIDDLCKTGVKNVEDLKDKTNRELEKFEKEMSGNEGWGERIEWAGGGGGSDEFGDWMACGRMAY